MTVGKFQTQSQPSSVVIERSVRYANILHVSSHCKHAAIQESRR
jgi:hypothetical protein